jgi:GxxExxY protein
MQFNDLSGVIIGCAIELHKQLGPGLLESAYEECLHYELIHKGLIVERQKPIPIVYKEIRLDCGYRLDILVNKDIIVEIKSVESLTPVHTAQVLTYLKFAKIHTGLLVNFNVTSLSQGIKRLVM